MVGILKMLEAASVRFNGRLTRGDRGATAVEYGMIVALIAAVIIAVVGFLGLDVLEAFNAIEDVLYGNDG